jgi:hypothetical protein
MVWKIHRALSSGCSPVRTAANAWLRSRDTRPAWSPWGGDPGGAEVSARESRLGALDGEGDVDVALDCPGVWTDRMRLRDQRLGLRLR